VILGRGGAGKSVLARRLGQLTGLAVTELDALFWQATPDGPVTPDPAEWSAREQELLRRDSWIIDGDLGPYDEGLAARLRAADTVVVLDFGLLRCASRTVSRGRENADYWRWVWNYRSRSLPLVMQAITAHVPKAAVHVLRSPAIVRRFIAAVSAQLPGTTSECGGMSGDAPASHSGVISRRTGEGSCDKGAGDT
jgi:adenylate kinase family enzyme